MATIDVASDPGEAKGRKRSADRIAQFLDVAEAMIRRSVSLPLPMHEISEAMGASRALVYAYFSDSDALVEAVLVRHLDLLADAGLEDAAAAGPVRQRAAACAALYLRHIAGRGNVVHNILREVPHGVRLSGATVRRRNRLLKVLATAARHELRLATHEAVVLCDLISAIPEELGRLVHRGDLNLDEALAIGDRLVLSAIDSLTPAAALRSS